MNLRRIIPAIALAAFVFEGAAVLFITGVGASVDAMFANPVTRFMLFELALCLVMLSVWMWRDARQRGVNPVPYVAATLVLGAPGALFYFVRHPGEAADRQQDAGVRAAQPA